MYVYILRVMYTPYNTEQPNIRITHVRIVRMYSHVKISMWLKKREWAKFMLVE